MTGEPLFYEHAGRRYLLPKPLRFLADLQQACIDQGINYQQIANLLAVDQHFTQYLLQIVNSSVFHLSSQVNSVQRAVNLLGISRITNLATEYGLQIALATYMNESQLKGFWTTIHQEAMVCSAIAERIDGFKPSDAYLLGLFHDCAIPVLMHEHKDYLKRLRGGGYCSRRFICDMERDSFGCDHAILSYQIAKAWHIPNYICQVILVHHDIDMVIGSLNDDTTDVGRMIALLLMAEHVCDRYKSQWRLLGSKHAHVHIDILMRRLGLNESMYNDLVVDMAQSLRLMLKSDVM